LQMNDNDIDLRSVNWQYGMLMTPEHLFRQEKYVDSTWLWILRYCTQAYGVVGAGPRIESSERGAAKYDSIVDIYEDDKGLKVSVSQCRGLSPTGDIIDVDPSWPVDASFPKLDLEGLSEVDIWVLCEPHDKVVDEALEDPVNPQMRSLRRRLYRVKVGATAAEASHGLLLGRLKKSERTLRFERVGGFIPVCTTMASHSELFRAWHRLREQVSLLADRYQNLHKAIVEYIRMADPHEISTEGDEETLRFASRMVTGLEACAYEALDPMQPPQRFFQIMYRAIRSAALYLDLSPPTRDYFRQLAEVGETEFDFLLDQERLTLLTGRELTIHDDLSQDVQEIERGLNRLSRLEEALDGKYLDFRVSPALEALHFFFDVVSGSFYHSVARLAHPQKFRDEITFVFAPLKLEGRQRYRLVLLGYPDARFELGTTIGAEIKMNAGAGQSHRPIYEKATCEIPDQRNFAVDFDVLPEIHTIADLRVILNATSQVRSCMLYQMRRLQRSTSLAPNDNLGRLSASEQERSTPRFTGKEQKRKRLEPLKED
jgi:hypothetical protein